MMNYNNKFEYFCNTLLEIYKDEASPKEKLLSFLQIYKEIFNDLLTFDNQYFSGTFSHLIYLADKYQFDTELYNSLKKLEHFKVKIRKDRNFLPTSNQINISIISLSKLLKVCYKIDLTSELSELFENLNIESVHEFSKTFNLDSEKGRIKATVKSLQKVSDKYNFKLIICFAEDEIEFELRLKGRWTIFYEQCYEGAIVNIINATIIKNIIETNSDTILVLNPDYLFDASELSETFNYNGYYIPSYYLRKLLPGSISDKLVLGNVVNSLFDLLITDINTEFEDNYINSLKNRPLQVFSVVIDNQDLKRTIRERANAQFNNLKKIIPKYVNGVCSIEPSFISPIYGLQGRLDVLSEYEDNAIKKDVIELKSGAPPNIEQLYQFSHGKKIQTGLNPSHLIQATAYNLLLDSSFQGRTGSSMILYSGAVSQPVRNAQNDIGIKQDLIELRNWICKYDFEIAKGNIKIEDIIFNKEYKVPSGFIGNDKNKFDSFFTSLREIDIDYLNEYVGFIFREMIIAKTGDDLISGYSSMWNDALDEKIANYNIIPDMKLIFEESDFDNKHLVFSFDESLFSYSTFRNGDLAILNKSVPNGNFIGSIIKGTIKSITKNKVLFSLRNKLSGTQIFQDTLWNLEPDYIDSLNKTLFQSIYTFLSAPAYFKDIIYGRLEPKVSNMPVVNFEYLSVQQNKILNQAISSENYYLIQGPPGTGKTSYMLRAIVENLYFETEEKILVLAYTNRAVDEICSALKRITSYRGTEIDFIRLGSKESSEYKDNLLSVITEKNDINHTFKKIKNCRVIVSTVASVLTNIEIFKIFKFNRCIVDEASQILECYLVGIISKVPKFILIGDEKQLPAITLQNEVSSLINSSLLNDIGFTTKSESLFLRLTRNCYKNNWLSSVGLLTQQARMHSEVMDFPNKYFYNGKLQIYNPIIQESSTSIFDEQSENKFEQILSKNRFVFFNVGNEKKSKVNLKEIEIVKELISLMAYRCNEKNNPYSIGVISPFRAQVAEIIRNIPEDIIQSITVDTVERYQGSERDVIIISLATNFKQLLKSIQSIIEIDNILIDRKLNVALTRAREYTIITGNSEVLSNNIIFKQLIDYCKDKGCYFDLSYFDSNDKINNLHSF